MIDIIVTFSVFVLFVMRISYYLCLTISISLSVFLFLLIFTHKYLITLDFRFTISYRFASFHLIFFVFFCLFDVAMSAVIAVFMDLNGIKRKRATMNIKPSSSSNHIRKYTVINVFVVVLFCLVSVSFCTPTDRHQTVYVNFVVVEKHF